MILSDKSVIPTDEYILFIDRGKKYRLAKNIWAILQRPTMMLAAGIIIMMVSNGCLNSLTRKKQSSGQEY